ncbi:peroxisome biogenesis factor 10-like [Coccinella septempunctata]|uniref:peroxisome biogenesis factor 10-like n=1 Tax=Coccinella septempunctata TaxID=41139 RepID=UPI001D094731|nr:peroxisome biogenesis factor 10-like [Coccinella septempunctata]
MFSKKAQVVDILRCMQRDDLAIKALEENIQSLSKSLGSRNDRIFRKYIPIISSLWYYYVTTGNNLQTLGEEYSNILRFTSTNGIPSRMTQLIWLILHIGGESVVDRLISYMESQVKSSGELREEARKSLLNLFSIWNIIKCDLLTIHKAIFYLNGTYYTFAHRLSGIQYVILRDWLEDKSFHNSFKILGIITIIYSAFNISKKVWANRFNQQIETESLLSTIRGATSDKICVLCNEKRKNPSSTPCGHVFCWECIYESLSYTHKCPLCREEVIPSRVIFLQNFI